MSRTGLRLLFYLGVAATAVGGLGLCVSSIPSDPFVDWTVINSTDSELLTWLHERDCGRVVGYQGEYSAEERVPPRAVLEYSDYGFSDGCVQVASLDRRIVVAQEYGSDLVINVEEPLTYLSEPVPREDELPRAPSAAWWRQLTIDAAPELVIMEFSVLLVVIGLPAVIGSERALRRRGMSP